MNQTATIRNFQKVEKPKGEGWTEMLCECGRLVGWTRMAVYAVQCEECFRKEMAYRNGWKK